MELHESMLSPDQTELYIYVDKASRIVEVALIDPAPRRRVQVRLTLPAAREFAAMLNDAVSRVAPTAVDVSPMAGGFGRERAEQDEAEEALRTFARHSGAVIPALFSEERLNRETGANRRAIAEMDITYNGSEEIEI